MKLKFLLFFVASAISLHSFAGEYNFDGTDYDRNIKTLDWSEEFDVDGRPNPEKWDYEVGYVRNKEAQYYTKDDPKNTRVENGMLVIEAVKDESSPNKITSASVITLNKKEFLYGRIEVRAKIPGGRGTWPAIWLLGVNRSKLGWPKCGEIDIMEEVGFDEDVLTANVHTYGSAKLKTENIKKGWRRKIENACADFHVYALEWTPQSLKFFIDGKFLGEYPRPKNPDYWHFDKPMYLLMNLAIGGSWGGKKGIDDAIFPAKYYIDYVRYYK